MTSSNVVVNKSWHLLLASFWTRQFKTNNNCPRLRFHTKLHVHLCLCACACKVMQCVTGLAECSPFTPVAAAAGDSMQRAHMYHESLWSEALNHSSIYSINSFLLWHLIIHLPLWSEQFLPTPLPLTELPSTYWEVSFCCAKPSADVVSVSEVISVFSHWEQLINWKISCWDLTHRHLHFSQMPCCCSTDAK